VNDDQVPHGRHTELELAQGRRAAATCATGLANGLNVHLFGGSVWAADDPVVTEHEGSGLFVDELPEDMLCRTSPDPARLESARLMGEAEAGAKADRASQPTRTLLPY
jgi:hypothetical protein